MLQARVKELEMEQSLMQHELDNMSDVAQRADKQLRSRHSCLVFCECRLDFQRTHMMLLGVLRSKANCKLSEPGRINSWHSADTQGSWPDMSSCNVSACNIILETIRHV